MARKAASRDARAEYLAENKRWLALMAHWNAAASKEEDRELREQYLTRGALAFVQFNTRCADSSQLIHLLTKACPFNGYDICFDSPHGGRWGRRRYRGVKLTAKRAVELATVYKKPVVVTGYTLAGEKYKVLRVNDKGEIMYVHPQFKFKLSESGGVV